MTTFFEKRAHFRCDMLKPFEASATIISVNTILTNLNKPIMIKIFDLSVGGMRIQSAIDFPIQAKLILEIKFHLEGEHFSILFQPIRRRRVGTLIEYGGKFKNISQTDEIRLGRILNQYKLKAKKLTSNDLGKDKEIGVFVKIIEAIPEPTYLVSSQHVILATNAVARELRVRIGERCHLTIFGSKKICSHCLITESEKYDKIISETITVSGASYRAYWLYLQKDLYLHYIKKI